MTGMTGPISGQNNLSVAQQGLKLLQARDQSLGNTGKSDDGLASKGIAGILNASAGRPFWRPSTDFLAVLNTPEFNRPELKQKALGDFQVVGQQGERRDFSGSAWEGWTGPESAVLADNSTVNAAGNLVGYISGNNNTLNVGGDLQNSIAGNNITANVGGNFSANIHGNIHGNNVSTNIAGEFRGKIEGNDAIVNVAGDAMAGQIIGDNNTLNVAGLVWASKISGNNNTLNAGLVSLLFIDGDDTTVNIDTLASSATLKVNGTNLTLNVDKTLYDVQVGAYSYVDPKTGETARWERSSGEGNINLRIRDAAGKVETGDGDDVLIVGSAVAVGGGRGDDTIKVGSAKYVGGGWGNDNIEVGAGVERVGFARGDGHDVVTADKGTTIEFRALSRDKVRISAEDGTYRISFEDSDDTIELRTQEGATSRLSFGRLQGSIELKDGAITYV